MNNRNLQGNEPVYLGAVKCVEGQWRKSDVILFPFKVDLNSERLCVSQMEMGKIINGMSVQGLSGWILTDSSLLSGLINCKRKIILWLTFQRGPQIGYVLEIQNCCHCLCVGIAL